MSSQTVEIPIPEPTQFVYGKSSSDLFLPFSTPKGKTMIGPVHFGPAHTAVIELLHDAWVSDSSLPTAVRGWRKAEYLAEQLFVERETIARYLYHIEREIKRSVKKTTATLIDRSRQHFLIERKPRVGARIDRLTVIDLTTPNRTAEAPRQNLDFDGLPPQVLEILAAHGLSDMETAIIEEAFLSR